MEKIKIFLIKPQVFNLFKYLFIIFVCVLSPIVFILTNTLYPINFSPDTSFFYSVNDFYSSLNQVGQSGRQFYIIIRWTFDLFYPIVYGIFLSQILLKLKIENTLYLILPLLMVIFDYIENSLATILVSLHRHTYNFFVYVLQIFSMLKWLTLVLIILLIIKIYLLNKNVNTI